MLESHQIAKWVKPQEKEWQKEQVKQQKVKVMKKKVMRKKVMKKKEQNSDQAIISVHIYRECTLHEQHEGRQKPVS